MKKNQKIGPHTEIIIKEHLCCGYSFITVMPIKTNASKNFIERLQNINGVIIKK